jgi:LCP family protein required for cell wall assembly
MELHTDDPDLIVLPDPVAAGSAEIAQPVKSKLRTLRKSGKRVWSLRKRIIIWILVAIATVLVVSGAWVAWKFISNATKAANGNILGLLSSTKLNGEDQGRVNILLAGNSADDPNHGGALLTDSIMIISLDTKNNTAFAMSIPRDLWVKVPGYGYQKINAVYPEGGMGLLEQVVDQDFGINMNYYGLVNYTAFKEAVNAVGGIDVTIKSSDPRGIYDPNIATSDAGPLILKNGLQHLSGQTALNLARARNDPTADGRYGYGLPNGDFDRAANQRLMLVALKNKIFTSGVAANPVKLGQLFDALGNNVKTNFKTNELRRLYTLGKAIDSSKIQSLSLTTNKLITNFTASDGEAALVPTAGVGDFSQIQAYMKQLTSTDPVVREGAKIVVLNASGTSGLAKTTATKLQATGMNVVDYGNATGVYTSSELVDASKGTKPLTLTALKKTYGTNVITSSGLTTLYPTVDIIIVLGPQASGK